MVNVTESYPGALPAPQQKSDSQAVPVGQEDLWVNASDMNNLADVVTAIGRAQRLTALIAAIAPAGAAINGKAFRFSGIDATSGLGRADPSLATDLNKAWAAAVEKIEEGGDTDGTASNTALFGVGCGLVSGTFATGTLYGLSSDGSFKTHVAGTLSPIAIGLNSTTAYLDVSGRFLADDSTLEFTASGNLGIKSGAVLTLGNTTINGTLDVVGALGTVAIDSNANSLTFSRPGANYIYPTHASGTLNLGTPGLTASALSITSAGVVINTDGNVGVDFRVETDTVTDALLIDASSETTAINVPTTIGSTLDVKIGDDGLAVTATLVGQVLESNDSIYYSIRKPDNKFGGFYFNEGTDGSASMIRQHYDGVNSRYEFRLGNTEVFRLSSNAGAVFNEDGDSTLNFRVESDNNAHMLFIDSGNDRVGINIASPSDTLDVGGSIGISNTTVIDSNLNRTKSVETGITASTTQTQGQQPLTKDINDITVVANVGDVVTLKTAFTGATQVLKNNGANTMQIFPASGDNIQGAGVNTAVTLASGTSVHYYAVDATNWIATSLSTIQDGLVYVFSTSDLPAPVDNSDTWGTAYYLEAKTYMFVNDISIAYPIVATTDADGWTGLFSETFSTLTYTGAGTMFVGDLTTTISNLITDHILFATTHASAVVFGIEGGNSVQFDACVFDGNDTADMGTIKSVGLVTFRETTLQKFADTLILDSNTITYTAGFAIDPQNNMDTGGALIEVRGTVLSALFTSSQMIPRSGDAVFDIDTGFAGAFTANVINLVTAFSGIPFDLTGLDQSDPKVTIVACPNFPLSNTIGGLYTRGNASNTTIAKIGETLPFTSVTDSATSPGTKVTLIMASTGTVANGETIHLPNTAYSGKYVVSNLVANVSLDIIFVFDATDAGDVHSGWVEVAGTTVAIAENERLSKSSNTIVMANLETTKRTVTWMYSVKSSITPASDMEFSIEVDGDIIDSSIVARSVDTTLLQGSTQGIASLVTGNVIKVLARNMSSAARHPIIEAKSVVVH